MIDKPIYVTSPLLPSLEDFTFLLKEIWESKMLTNNGNFHQKLEEELAKYLKVPYLSLFTNGTLPLITALQAMRITGEVITTPFSFVATTHSLWWNGIKPVFVDIEPETCNLDPSKIEAAITPRTTAIMPVHVYGKPCKTKEIQEIANKYGLKVIYDAAHAFGVEINGESILNFGDMATLSFHATKVYNTLEGGALVVHDEQTKKRIDYLKIAVLTILILALLTLPFLPFILFDARRRKAMERRAAFDSPDCREAIRAMFLHLAAYLDRCGKGVGNRPFSQWDAALAQTVSPEYAAQFRHAAALFEESAYSTHAMGEEQRAELQSLLTETERLLYDNADRRTKIRLKYVECLHA